MSYRPHYTSGDWVAICDVCGRLYEASSLRQRWDGFMVCHQDFETRHPQDFVRGVIDMSNTPWSRSEASDSFINADGTTATYVDSVSIVNPTVTVLYNSSNAVIGNRVAFNIKPNLYYGISQDTVVYRLFSNSNLAILRLRLVIVIRLSILDRRFSPSWI